MSVLLGMLCVMGLAIAVIFDTYTSELGMKLEESALLVDCLEARCDVRSPSSFGCVLAVSIADDVYIIRYASIARCCCLLSGVMALPRSCVRL